MYSTSSPSLCRLPGPLFLKFFSLLLLLLLLSVGDSGGEVSWSAALTPPPPPFPPFVGWFQLFETNIPALCESTDMKGLVLAENTVIRALIDRNIILPVHVSVFIAVTDKSLDLPFSFSVFF